MKFQIKIKKTQETWTRASKAIRAVMEKFDGIILDGFDDRYNEHIFDGFNSLESINLDIQMEYNKKLSIWNSKYEKEVNSKLLRLTNREKNEFIDGSIITREEKIIKDFIETNSRPILKLKKTAPKKKYKSNEHRVYRFSCYNNKQYIKQFIFDLFQELLLSNSLDYNNGRNEDNFIFSILPDSNDSTQVIIEDNKVMKFTNENAFVTRGELEDGLKCVKSELSMVVNRIITNLNSYASIDRVSEITRFMFTKDNLLLDALKNLGLNNLLKDIEALK